MSNTMDYVSFQDRLQNGSITDIKEARHLAKLLLEKYDTKKNGNIEEVEVSKMIKDTYVDIDSNVELTDIDMKEYFQTLDRNRDGKITLQDLEALCVKYLVGENAFKMHNK